MQNKQNENPEIKVIFGPFFFLTVFRHFSVSEYYKYSRTARNIVRFTTGMNILQKTADHLRTGASCTEQARQKEPETAIYNHNTTIPAPRQP